MAGRAVLFGLDAKEAQRLLTAACDAEVIEIVDEIEERWEVPRLAELDKAWDALHRCLTDGTLTFGGGDYPLSHAILGGRLLHKGDDYIVSFVDSEQVRDIAYALEPLDERWLRSRFASLVFSDYEGSGSEEDIAYTLTYLPELQDFYRDAAHAGRPAIFTVDR